MNEKLLITALRNKAAEVRQVNVTTAKEDQTLRDAADLLRVLANIMGGMPTIKAFGPPGDWGYDNEIGKSIAAMREGTCAARSDPLPAPEAQG